MPLEKCVRYILSITVHFRFIYCYLKTTLDNLLQVFWMKYITLLQFGLLKTYGDINLVNIGSGIGLRADGAELLLDAMLTYHHVPSRLRRANVFCRQFPPWFSNNFHALCHRHNGYITVGFRCVTASWNLAQQRWCNKINAYQKYGETYCSFPILLCYCRSNMSQHHWIKNPLHAVCGKYNP